ncbi:MAG: hypothetical protein DCO99_03570 [Synechococcus sp. XM-24]|nr:MAG: hypothetical protein DCO99_03570 [Synechococcus sp. XM-24]
MARRKPKNNSGAPAIKPGMGGNPVNPLGLSKGGANPLFLDVTVARDYYAENSEWKRWSADDKAQALWAAPVQPRR